MIESLIGRPGTKLRRLLTTMSVVGATTLSLLAGAMTLASPSALAAGPEAPKTEPANGVTAKTATLNGVVNPLASEPPEEGKWQFLYKATSTISKAECESVGASKAPIAAEPYGDAGPEAVATGITGLTAATEYVVCLRVEGNVTTEATVGEPVAFKTAVPPQEPVTSSPAEAITATTATLEGELNPTKEAETGYYFLYSTEAEGTCAASGKATEPAVAPAKVAAKTKVDVEATGLQPHQKYVFCLVATNTAEPPEAVQSTTEVKFETLVAPPEVSENIPALVNSPTIAEAGTINPNNQTTECHVQYGEELLTVSVENEVACEPPSLTGSGPQTVGVTLTGLKPAGKYHYRIVAKNEKAEETQGTEAEFETVALPSELKTGAAEAVTTTGAKFGGKLNPGGEATYYVEYGTAPCGVSTCGGAKTTEAVLGGSTQQAIEPPLEVSGLQPHTTYHYWLVATNGAGTVHGEAREFTTDIPPSEIETGSAEDITTTSAEFTGELDPGAEATYYFEYGPAQCSDAPVTCGTKTAAVVLTGEAQQTVAPVIVSGLQPNTIYHYWLVATNASVSEPVHSDARVFRTPATPAEVEAEAAAKKRPEEEAAAANAAKQKAEEQVKREEAATAAAAAAAKKQYEEIAAVTASSKRQEEALKRQEELIAATSVKITKVKVGAGGVQVTIRVSQAGTVTITGSGLKKKSVAKLAAGTHTIKVALNSTGKKARKHHKKTTVAASLDTSLTSVSTSTSVKL